jgi:sodium/bile acid cotransporter 7
MLSFLRQRWFLIALISVLVAGIGRPLTMRPFSDHLSSDAILAAVTFMMALPLETSVLWRAVRQPGPAWLGTLVNSGLAPPLGWLTSRMLPAELAAGVILATTVPSTLASAAVLTRRAGGNDAVCFLVTMITNLTCFVVVPAWLVLLIGVRAEVNFGAIVLKLFLWVVIPITAAQILRQWPPIGSSATRHKILLGGMAQVGILLMVLIGAVDCGERLAALESDSIVTPGTLALMIVAVTAVHMMLVIAGFALSRAISIGRDDAIAVAFSGSQKTLMVGAFLATAVAPLAILPMVAYHAAQLVIDTLIADWMRPRNQRGSRLPSGTSAEL